MISSGPVRASGSNVNVTGSAVGESGRPRGPRDLDDRVLAGGRRDGRRAPVGPRGRRARGRRAVVAVPVASGRSRRRDLEHEARHVAVALDVARVEHLAHDELAVRLRRRVASSPGGPTPTGAVRSR